MKSPTDYPRFWELLDAAGGDRERLKDLLQPLTRAEHLAFHRDFEFTSDSIRERWFPEQRSDSLQERCWWVVGQGSALFDEVMADPAKLPPEVPPHGRGAAGAITTTFFEKFGLEVSEADEDDPPA